MSTVGTIYLLIIASRKKRLWRQLSIITVLEIERHEPEEELRVIIPESVTFEEAIALTQSLMSQMETGELQGELVQKQISLRGFGEAITQLVKSENGARGFFVTYLTSEGTLADHCLKRSDPSTPSITGYRWRNFW
jgi:hypothetical protein